MNVVFVSVSMLWSGGTKAAGAPPFYKTIKAFHDAGHQVYLITIHENSAQFLGEGYKVISVLTHTPFLEKTRMLRIFKNSILFPLFALIQGIKLFGREPIDLIYGYEVHGVLAGFLLKLIFKKPLISRFQGTILYPLVLKPAPFIEKLKKIDHFLAFKVPASLAIMTNDGTYGDEVLQRLNPELAAKCLFIMNGVDSPTLTKSPDTIRQALNISPDTVVLMTISRLVNWKRVDRTIAALPLITAKYDALKLVIIGDGPERPALELLAQNLKVERHVLFVGMVEHTKIPEHLNIADIFLSLYDLSNLGNPLLEALRLGKPIITLDTGATNTVITHNMNGILLTQGTPQEVSQAVSELLSEPEKRHKLVQNARTYAENNIWDWKARLDHEIRIVTQLVETYRRQR